MYQRHKRLPWRLWMNWRLWYKLRAFPLVKVPGFATVLPQLQHAMVGRFRALYVVRDPRDNVASLLERLDKKPQNTNNHLFTDVQWLGVTATERTAALAWRWRSYLEIAQAYQCAQGAIEFVRYETFLADKSVLLDKIASKLQIPFERERVMPYLDMQFKKSWDQRIAGAERWRSELNPIQIETINEICGPLMEQWGYAESPINHAVL
jgi:hypothetical protein